MEILMALLLLLSWQLASGAAGRKVEKRQSGNLDFCYGNNSICAVQNNLYEACSAFQNPYIEAKWAGCICANGYVAVEEA
jgi:hypothetical protein